MPKTAYCSWCFEKASHHLFQKNIFRRNIYICDNCEKRSIECRYCEHMARGGDWDNELCAEHDGSIASFERLTDKLDDITEFSTIFTRDTYNLQKAGFVAGATAITATGIGGAAILGAGAIGGAVGGAAYGLTGAAATNAGLAAIGGGSLAAGGLGMAGGIAIIGAVGSGVGGLTGAVISNSYLSEIKGFDIKQLKEGKGEKILFIDGFLTEKVGFPDDWVNSITKKYPDNPLYYVSWESKRLLDLGKTLSIESGKTAVTQVVKKWAARAAKNSVKKAGALGVVTSVLSLANNPWSKALVKAGQTGVLLADLIARTDDKYILCGHSLGARVIYYALESLSTHESNFISEVHLLGGAVGNNSGSWEKASTAVSRNIYNYHTQNDWILASLYKAGTLFTSAPIGRNEISIPKVQNINVSKYVSGHTKYKENWSQFIA